MARYRTIANRVIENRVRPLYSSDDVAAALQEALDRPVKAIAVPRESWVETLAANGMPAGRSGAYIELVDGLNSGWIRFGSHRAENATGKIGLLPAVKDLAAHRD